MYAIRSYYALALPDVPKTAEGMVDLLSRWNQDIFLPSETVLYGNGGLLDIRIELLMDILRMYVIENGTGDSPINFDTPAFRNVVNAALNLPPLPYNAQGTSEPLLLCSDIV